MHLTNPSKTVFHTIKKTIKSYRKFSQRNVSKIVDDITIDQILILQFLNDYPNLNQTEIAELIFTDKPSMTRMINIMVKKKYLKRLTNSQDRRGFRLELSTKGKEVLLRLPPIIKNNRKKALSGITKEEIILLEEILNKILLNLK